ncbi:MULTISPECIES: hypothetical protein [unclassified Pseudonocardia]|uniref:hypothetical protein n=1 Tax=unclassified Pseudonocardia TaxID=2619320 RepID=UPI0011152229|nr:MULTISPECIES: hypothetical protein [unclassified Pseudonocardia]
MAVSMGSATGIASAGSLPAHAGLAASASDFSQPPEIVADGLEGRLAALPQNPTQGQVYEAFYPGDREAQEIAQAVLDPARPQQFGAAETAWKVTKCAAAIGAFIAGNTLLISKAAKFGGVLKGAKLIMQAGTREEKNKLILAMLGEVTGISTIHSNCF